MNKSDDRKYIWISEQVLQFMISASHKVYPNEAGGIVTGVSVEGRPWITMAIETPESGKYQSKLLIPFGWRPSIVREIRQKDKRMGYIGEWHSHRSDMGPSDIDMESIERIADDKTGESPQPILAILRRNNDSYTFDIREWETNELKILEIVITGDLPRIKN